MIEDSSDKKFSRLLIDGGGPGSSPSFASSIVSPSPEAAIEQRASDASAYEDIIAHNSLHDDEM